jgi:chemotaxis protein CheD
MVFYGRRVVIKDEYVEIIAAHYLYPSAIFASQQPHEVSTVLGSCVSICLWDTHAKFGGINHFMLPLWNGDGLPTPKFGNIALEKLLEKMLFLGCNQKKLVAKVFGGAKQLEKGKSVFNVGERNIQLAFDMLKEAGIPVVSHHVGGEKGRKLKYATHTGEVLLKLL